MLVTDFGYSIQLFPLVKDLKNKFTLPLHSGKPGLALWLSGVL